MEALIRRYFGGSFDQAFFWWDCCSRTFKDAGLLYWDGLKSGVSFNWWMRHCRVCLEVPRTPSTRVEEGGAGGGRTAPFRI